MSKTTVVNMQTSDTAVEVGGSGLFEINFYVPRCQVEELQKICANLRVGAEIKVILGKQAKSHIKEALNVSSMTDIPIDVLNRMRAGYIEWLGRTSKS